MKKLLLLPLIAFSFVATAQTTAIPDANFEQALINLGLDNVIDGGVLTANINTVLTLDVSYKGISDLTGIEDFTASSYLFCQGNQLTNIDVSQNINLISLDCRYNQLTTLDVSQNTALTDLGCGHNQLTTLDVSQNTTLDLLFCDENQLICLNVANGNNSNFTSFYATVNPNLSCIEVDDVAYSDTTWTNIDVQTSFSTNCTNPCVPSSINEAALNAFELYPNPTASTITLNNLKLGDEVSVYNTLGQGVYSSKVSAVTLSINLSELGNNGIYFVRVNNISERVLLNR